jgi:hypothetical protein
VQAAGRGRADKLPNKQFRHPNRGGGKNLHGLVGQRKVAEEYGRAAVKIGGKDAGGASEAGSEPEGFFRPDLLVGRLQNLVMFLGIMLFWE